MHTTERTIDGAVGEGWGGKDPDGCHVHVILARRATRKAVGMAVSGRDPAAVRALVERRDGLRNPYYSGT